MDQQVKQEILRLVNTSRDVIVCSIDDKGFPNAKAMFRAGNDGVRTFWFSTNTSSIRTGHFMQRPQACIYFLDSAGIHGVMFTGQMKVHSDNETKAAFWKDGQEIYYPLGPTDPDYSILSFTAERGNYYHGLKKHLFSISELED